MLKEVFHHGYNINLQNEEKVVLLGIILNMFGEPTNNFYMRKIAMGHKTSNEAVKVIFDNTYTQLPNQFFQDCKPAVVSNPQLIQVNKDLLTSLGLPLDGLTDDEIAGYFSGNTIFEDSQPIAMAYAGHQFGSFVSQLGDGRAILLGEVVTKHGNRYDIQLKGSGRTAYSRGGDGKSALGPVLREYIVSEAMHTLGIPTTRALAMVTTGEEVFRQTGKIPGGILTRVASGFVRVGTFEYFFSRNDNEAVKQLADYVIARHYPEAARSENPYLTLFEMVCDKQARLVARWMEIGFIHGVMNTDNTAISGETIDYGPCAFMDHYDPNTVFSSIDMHGRYRFVNQGSIIAWNLSSLGNCLFSLFSDDKEEAKQMYEKTLKDLQTNFLVYWKQGMNKKLGLSSWEDDDLELLKEFLDILQAEEVDYTLGFRYLSDNTDKSKDVSKRFIDLFSDQEKVIAWLKKWQVRFLKEQLAADEITSAMNEVNPAFIPRNHRIEAAINLAEKENDFSEVHRLIKILATPFVEQQEYEEYMKPPKPEERVLQTFCGT